MRLTLLIFGAIVLAVSPVEAQDAGANAAKKLVGTWRIVSYPTSEGDLLRRHGRRPPGPVPDAKEALTGWP